MRKYKESLGLTSEKIILEHSNPNSVIIKTLRLECEGEDSRHNQEMDISGKDLSQLKKQPFYLKEGTRYKIAVDFMVQREMVSGLKYTHKVTKAVIPVDNDSEMFGSFAPSKELRTIRSQIRDVPSGIFHRGKYSVKSKFIDDDKKVHAEWEWTLEIKDKWKN